MKSEFELEKICNGDCYNCKCEEECDKSQVAEDELLNSLDEW